MRLPALLLATLLLAGCAANDDTTPTPDPDGTAPPADAEPEEVAVSLFEAPGVGVPPTTMGIDPAALELVANTAYVLVVTNDGQLGHNLVIDGLEVATETLGIGGVAEVALTPTEPGEYAMYCSVGGDGPTGHRAQGMAGTVTVA